MHNRGRDRAVASSAAARRASEERLRARISRSPSPSPSSSASLSPRSHSPTLTDRVHMAYAADDIHQARVLLLRLQGIEVTSDSDPRIAAVTDDDFDAVFVPYGLDETISIPVAPPKPPPPRPDTRRTDNLKEKERIWEMESHRFAEERFRRDSVRRMQIEREREADRMRMIKQKEAAAAVVDLRRRRMQPTARTLNFALVPAVPAPPPKFTYDFPFTPRNAHARPPPPPRISPVRRPEPPVDKPLPQPNRVSFQQVLACMRGELFPLLPDERHIPRTADRAEALRQAAFLNVLLDCVPDEKGKGRAVPIRCTDSPPSPSTPSTSSSGLSRAGSWLSFTSSSRSSTSTVASSWISDAPSPILKSPSRRLSISSVGSWLPGARRTASPESQAPRVHVHASKCRCRDAARSPTSTHPLLPDNPPPKPTPNLARDNAGSLAHTLGRLTALAKTVQTAYVRAVVVGYGGVSPEWDLQEVEEHDLSLPPPPMQKPAAPPPPPPRAQGQPQQQQRQLRPRGARASVADVRNFVSAFASASSACVTADAPASSDDELVPSATLSPLAPRSRTRTPAPTARTQLPSRLPYERVFTPPAPLPRSPWATLVAARTVEDDIWAEKAPPSSSSMPLSLSVSTDGTDAWLLRDRDEPIVRDRTVPNSTFLRVKALHNYASDVFWGAPSSSSLPVPARPRWPKELVVAQTAAGGCASGSRLRFVYSCAREREGARRQGVVV